VTLVAVWSDDPAKHVYIGADSRLADVDDASSTWDSAAKLFPIADFPEVVAYCGKTEPLLVAMSQMAQCLRYTDLLARAGSKYGPQLESRVEAACRHLDHAIKGYPSGWMRKGGSMVFAGFDYRLRRPRVFRTAVTVSGVKSRSGKNPYELDELKFGDEPVFLGSGATVARKYAKNGKRPFDCLKAVILSGKVPTVGGVPQVVRVEEERVVPIGIVWNANEPFLNDMRMFFRSAMSRVEWRDRSFRECEYPLRARVIRMPRRGGGP